MARSALDCARFLPLCHALAITLCVCKSIGIIDADVNAMPGDEIGNKRAVIYWRLWLFDAVLVSAGVLFFLATRYGTFEFFGKAIAMALLPFIAVMVLVGGAGSTIFALTKILIEKRSLKFFTSLVLLVGPALVVALLLILLAAAKSEGHRLAYICVGDAPAAASHVQITGYSTFLREEWLAVFNVDQQNFGVFVAREKLEPIPSLEYRLVLERSSLKTTRPFQNLPRLGGFICYKRVFKESEEHKRGRVYAAFDPATSTAVVLREYQD